MYWRVTGCSAAAGAALGASVVMLFTSKRALRGGYENDSRLDDGDAPYFGRGQLPILDIGETPPPGARGTRHFHAAMAAAARDEPGGRSTARSGRRCSGSRR